jgi:hypothetical protein
VTIPLADDVVVHRVGGATVASLQPTVVDLAAIPPGLSVLLGGTPHEAADEMRRAYPNSRKWQRLAGTVASTTAGQIRAAGFDVIPVPTGNLPSHGRIVHPDGVAGFTDANLARLATVFVLTTGC